MTNDSNFLPLWLPFAERHLIAIDPNTDPHIISVGDIFHVAESNANSLFELFSNDGGIEATGYIRKDGSVEQYRPLNIECDSQFDGNSFVRSDGKRYGFNSWESQGFASEPWTDAQIETIKKIIAWKHKNYQNPLRVCPAWDLDGVGYHRLFPRWNKTNHSCPGDIKVKQFNDIIVPWMKSGGIQGDWLDMVDENTLRKIIQEEVGNAQIVVDPKGAGAADDQTQPLNLVLRRLLNDEPNLRAVIRSSAADVKQAIVDSLPSGGGSLSHDQVVAAVEQGVKNVFGTLGQ